MARGGVQSRTICGPTTQRAAALCLASYWTRLFSIPSYIPSFQHPRCLFDFKLCRYTGQGSDFPTVAAFAVQPLLTILLPHICNDCIHNHHRPPFSIYIWCPRTRSPAGHKGVSPRAPTLLLHACVEPGAFICLQCWWADIWSQPVLLKPRVQTHIIISKMQRLKPGYVIPKAAPQSCVQDNISAKATSL